MNSFSAFNTLFLQLLKTAAANLLLQLLDHFIYVHAAEVFPATGAHGHFAGFDFFVATDQHIRDTT